MKKFQQLSQQLHRQISQNQFRPGDKLPSIRSLSQQTKMSKNTVIRAYMSLEDAGLIKPLDRSGYVVCNTPPVTTTGTVPVPHEVKLGSTALGVIRAAGNLDGVALGSAHPAVQFPACQQFYRLLAREAHRFANDNKMGGHYTDPAGHLPLRQLLARRMELQGGALSANEMIITNGAMEAISLALQSVASAGDIIAVEKPAYYGSLNCIEALGMKVLEIPCHQETGMDLKLLREALLQWPVKAILVNPTFNNPMGFSMPVSNRLQLLQIATTYDLPIIEDDTFAELYFGQSREPALKQLDRDGRVIYCSSLSKTLHSDIRLGWAAAGRYFEQMIYMKYVSSLASPGILQFTAAHFLDGNQYERHLRRVRRHYYKAKEDILEAIYRYWPSPVSVSHPAGGFLLWCTLPEDIEGDRLYEQAKEKGINIAPGSLFSCDMSFSNCIRLNFATWQNTPVFIDALKELSCLIAKLHRS
jgi:DNA-binding transcriptional MocR family regulator